MKIEEPKVAIHVTDTYANLLSTYSQLNDDSITAFFSFIFFSSQI